MYARRQPDVVDRRRLDRGVEAAASDPADQVILRRLRVFTAHLHTFEELLRLLHRLESPRVFPADLLTVI